MENYEISEKIELLISYANEYLSLQITDNNYVRNALMELMRVDEPNYNMHAEVPTDVFAQVLTPLSSAAIEKGIIEDTERDRFETKLLGLVTPAPSQITEMFDNIVARDNVKAATNWLYELCCRSNYVRSREIKRNIVINHTDPVNGDLVITINLSKPEKDPRDIAKAKSITAGYPKCMLCIENEGYPGRPGYPARQTLRTIPLILNEEQWYMQFSPYGYYDQHCIVLCANHTEMKLTPDTFSRMIEFVEMIPHYFIGSNAPLPIVGGSILSHDHYQGGSKVHPMFRRPVRAQYHIPGFPSAKIGIVDWYNSVIRIKSKNRNELKQAVNYIYDSWCKYSDESVGIVAFSDNEPHNTVTPIVRFERGECYCELILRNNRVDEEHPYGIFHPTEDLHNIKKENIGLIEAIGTFILPGRLEQECREMIKYVSGERAFNEKELSNPDNPMYKHRFALVDMLTANGICSRKKAEEVVINYLKETCVKVIRCTAVFKNDEAGIAAFDRFMTAIGCKEGTLNEEEHSQKEEVKPAETEVKQEVPTDAVNPDNGEQNASEEPVKRKRGRPRKNPV